MSLAPGTRLGPYEVIALIGSGGMGEVYRARDTKLQRTVAIKVLTEQADDAAARLLQEARAASALNHPNVCTIHEVGEHDGQAFIVMEHVEGKPLSQLIPSDGLRPESVIRYGIQIADALAHAHEHGITHRDLKSANVVVTREGRAKVLDFGIATHLAKGDAEALTVSQDAGPEGRTLAGTLAYMAPEVLRGEGATARSDLWALGVLLYEMAAGQLPFAGLTRPDLVSAIIKESPAALSPKVSPGLRSIIQRCLAKELGQRYPSAAAAQAALEAIQSDTSVTPASSVTSTGGTRTWRGAAAVIGLVFVAGVVGYFLRSTAPDTPRSVVPRVVNPVQVTSVLGVEYPALSADAEWLAYWSEESGNPDVWVLRLGSGQAVNRTSENPGRDTWPRWSHDGRQIVFSSDDGGDRAIWVMDAFAGLPRKVAGGFAYPSWSAGGSRIAYLVTDDSAGSRQFFAEILDLQTGESRRLPLPGNTTDRLDLTWSPDERFFAYLDAFGRSSEAHRIWVMRADDGMAVPVTDRQTSDWSPTFSPDGSTLFYTSNRGGNFDLWQQPLDDTGAPQGEPQPVTTGMEIRHATLSGDGTKLAYVRGRRVANLWRVPILDDRLATWADAEQLTFDRAWLEAMALSPDGERLVLSTDRAGHWDLWVMPADGGEMSQLTTGITPEWVPDWSPDGQQIAFHGPRSGNRDIWILPAEGGPARQATTSEAEDVWPAWSPDGRRIAFGSDPEGNWNIWVMPAEGGEAKQVTVHQADDSLPRWAPDGRSIIFRSDRTGAPDLWQVSAEGGEPALLIREVSVRPAFSPDGKKIYFFREHNLWVRSLVDGAERLIADLQGRRGGVGSYMDSDGRHVYFPWQEDEGDIWVADLVYDEGEND